MVVTLDQQYNIGEKPTVMLYTYINRNAGTPEKNILSTYYNRFIIIYSNSAIDPYTIRTYSLEHKLCYNIVIVFVCFLPIHSGHQVRWTYQPGSHRRKVTQGLSSTFFLRCVP